METKKVLIPTDFTMKSLGLVKKALVNSPNAQMEIVLLHGAHLSNSITDMLFFSKSKILRELQSPEFVEACKLLKNKYPQQIKSLCVDVVIASSKKYFKNYVEANRINEVIVPSKSYLNFKKAKGFSTLSLLKSCGVNCIAIEAETEPVFNARVREQVSDLFFSELK